MGSAISADDVRDAAVAIKDFAVRTPLLEFDCLNDAAGRRVLVKFEGAQRMGSFKFRGAFNRLSRFGAVERKAGVVAWSSGNHAQGVAAASRLLGMHAVIVMPSDAPRVKLASTRSQGAEIVTYDRRTESREDIARQISARRGAVLVPSFDDPFVMAGQGTVGLEVLQQATDIGAKVSQILVPCGGGGLVSGIATIVKDIDRAVSVLSVEPAAFDDTMRSIASGEREVVVTGGHSICDALLAPTPGALTFPINRKLLSGGLAVTDVRVMEAMRFAFEKLKLVVEPGGAVALAAVLSRVAPPTDHATAIIISGGNVDPDLYASVIQNRR